jgi:hypothetical protein
MNSLEQLVLSELLRINLAIPVQIENDVIRAKAEIFAEDLEGWSLEAVTRAFRQLGQKSRFMPALADVIDECRTAKLAIDRERNEVLSRLPAPIVTEEDRAKNIERLTELRERMHKRLRAKA